MRKGASPLGGSTSMRPASRSQGLAAWSTSMGGDVKVDGPVITEPVSRGGPVTNGQNCTLCTRNAQCLLGTGTAMRFA